MSYFFNQNFNVNLSVIVGIFLFLHLYHNEIKPYFHNKHTQILFYLKIYMEKEIKKNKSFAYTPKVFCYTCVRYKLNLSKTLRITLIYCKIYIFISSEGILNYTLNSGNENLM